MLADELKTRVRTLRQVPRVIRGEYSRIQTQVLAAIVRAQEGTANACGVEEAWSLFVLLPRLLLHPVGRGGKEGARDLRRRVTLFDAGEWARLLDMCRDNAERRQSARRPLGSQEIQQARARAAEALIGQGELSHAARVLRSSGLADGSDATLSQLRDPMLRPQELHEPIPAEALEFAPSEPLRLDPEVFARVLQERRKGLAPGLSGLRNEHLRLCL